MRRSPARLAALAVVAASATICECSLPQTRDEYHEQLVMRPLADGKVLSNFQFSMLAGDDSWEGSRVDSTISSYHTTLLPRSLAAIVRAYHVEEVHLSLTSGRWIYDRWQDPIRHGSPSGGEIYAWLAEYEDDSATPVKERWTGLTNALGGLFCSSLNNLDERMTTSPVSTFFPADESLADQPFFHALLPLEHPCTENLTPFISLLPCRASAGLAQLLNPHKMFDANWQKLAVHISRHPESANLHITLEFEVVQDPVRMTLASGSQPRREWSFDSLFGRGISAACPVADSSIIQVDLADEDAESGYSLEPKSSNILLPAGEAAIYDVPSVMSSKGLSLSMRWPVMRPEGFQYPTTYTPAPLIAERINTGYGLERATLGIEIRNNRPTDIAVTWLEEWPWWMKVYMHALQVTVDDAAVGRDDIVRQMLYTQAQSRGRPTVIEADLLLPANSTTRIMLDVDKAYMRYTDYPPDNQRGLDVPSGVVYIPGEQGKSSGRRIYTASTLLDMPTPDFSMPYNVIILTCTVIALFFGNVFNLLTRAWLIVDLREPAPAVDGTAEVQAAIRGVDKEAVSSEKQLGMEG